jgi:hypothetical protein
MKNLLVKFFLTIVFLATISGCESQVEKTANAVQPNAESLKKAKVAHVWHGRTMAAKADEHEKYLMKRA